MNTKRWVQHMSGQGEKWEVHDEGNDNWVVIPKNKPSFCHRLPKSEYRLCDPPEEWRNVTREHDSIITGHWYIREGIRLRMVKLYKAEPDSEKNCEQWAFIVEQKVVG